jgi:hypothetical protein
MRRSWSALLLIALPSLLHAQGSTEDNLKKAIDMYQAFNIEGARPILLNIISPNYLLSVTPEQKVRALKYLGASYAVLDKADSAKVFFTAALDFDPFTDLDPREFSAAELGAFSEAKTRIFKVAVRPIVPQKLDSNFTFRLITTQRTNLIVEIVKQSSDSARERLYQSDNDGPREIRWGGFTRSGARADSGLYEIRATTQPQGVVATQLFKIEHVFEPLEDTLPSIPQSDLLREQYQPSAPWLDLAKGGALAAAAVALPLIALGKNAAELPSYTAHAGAAAGLGLAAATISFSYRRSHRAIPENVRENTRRQQQRMLFNAGVTARNRDRIARTIMLICPATGCPR